MADCGSANKRRSIRNVVLLFAVMSLISAFVFLVLWLSGCIYFKDGFHFSLDLFDRFRDRWYSKLIFIAIQILITVLLCFVPGTSAMMIGVAVAIWGSTSVAFLTCFVGVIVSSIAMDLLGRYGGSRIVVRMIGEEEYLSSMAILREKTYTYLPFMYLLPLFPDDALCFCAGTTKIKLWYHLLVIILFRGIGVATIVFGIGIIPYKEWIPFSEHIYDWFVCGGVLIAYVALLLKLARMIDVKLSNRFRKMGFIKGKIKEENDNGR